MEVQTLTYGVFHFLKDKRQIIVQLKNTCDRDRVWTNRSFLKGSSFYVSEDLPASLQKKHNQPLIVAKEAKPKNLSIRTKCFSNQINPRLTIKHTHATT